jgi:ABC-type glycerol-3-phosphate transport system substrate-binding protein
MILTGNWSLGTLREILKDDLGSFKFPAADADNSNKDFNYAGPGMNYCVTNYSKHPDESVKFAKHLASEEFQIAYCNECGAFPANIGYDLSKIDDPMTRDLLKIMESGNNSVVIDLLPMNSLNELMRVGSLVDMGKIPASDVCRLMDAEKEKSLKK